MESVIVENLDERDGRDVESRITEGIMCRVVGLQVFMCFKIEQIGRKRNSRRQFRTKGEWRSQEDEVTDARATRMEVTKSSEEGIP